MPITSSSVVPLSRRWWRSEPEQIHVVLQSVVHRLRERQKPRRDLMQLCAEMYGGSELSGLGLTAYDPASQVFHPASVSWNVVRNAVDTVVAKIAKNRPKATFITDHGDYHMMKKAKKLERFMDGLFYQLEVYRQTPVILRDACVFGTGILSVYSRGDQIHIERIFPWECITDIADARYGNPQNFYVVRWIDKDVLAEMFPEHEDAIRNSNVTTDDVDHITDYEAAADRILVTEAWHLPSGPDAEDGRHTVIVEGCTLLDEGYQKHYFPFVFMRYKQPVAGFWGNGLAEELQGWQSEMNLTAERVQQSHYISAGGIWMVPDGADIVDTELTNGVGMIVHHKPGMAPQYVNPPPINPATYDYLKELGDYALRYSGISQMSAQSQKPGGITAAKALQTLDDVETERFTPLGHAWEELHMDLTNHLIDLCKEINSEYPGYNVRAPLKRYSLVIDWDDVDMERDAFIMQIFPTALLAKTPAARLQQVQDLFQAQVIDRAMFLRLLDAPDINAEEDLESAAREVADQQIEFILDADNPLAPESKQWVEPFQDVVYALHRAQAHYNLARIQGYSNPYLAALRDYMSQSKRLLDMQNPPPPPPQAPPTAPTGGVGPTPMQGMPQQ